MLDLEEITEILTEIRVGDELNNDNPWKYSAEKEEERKWFFLWLKQHRLLSISTMGA